MAKGKVVGVGIDRVDAKGKVTGETRYAGDLILPDMCHGRILFSAYPRARVLGIDTASAGSLPGVKKIITAEHITGNNRYGYAIPHRPLLVGVGEETRFLGDAIALVVAETRQKASEALTRIRVDYNVLEPLTSPREAMAEGAFQIHKGVERNICGSLELSHGDIQTGWRDSAVIVEETYITSRQEQAFLEMEAGVAFVDETGMLHILSSIQDPYMIVDDVHQALNIPKGKIHVKGTPSGGAFGGKLLATMQVHLAAMAYLTGVPVKLVIDQRESFILHSKRHPVEIWVRLGAAPDGKIQALEAKVISDAGPYSGHSPETMGVTITTLVGPYSLPNVHITGQAVYTNNMDSGAMRGFGAPQAALARESILDKLARSLNMEPLVLRQKNFLQPDEETISPVLGKTPVSLEVLKDRILERMGPPPAPSPHPNRRAGRGYCFDMPVFDVSAVPMLAKSGVGITVEVFSDASACVYSGGTELGQGITTILAQIVSEELGMPIGDVSVEMCDTRTCPRSGRTSASRLTYVLGNSLLLATEKIRNTLLNHAAKMLEINRDDLSLEDGAVKVKGSPSRDLSLCEVTLACVNNGVKLREDGWYKYPEDRYMYGHTFMVSAADVEVDILTGAIEILKLVNIHDSGKIMNPVLAEGQLYGGAVQALGYTFMENFVVKAGRPMTPSFAEYLIPTSMDMPGSFEVGWIETPYPTGPYGAKGMAEHALNSTTPAVLNAILDAIGVAMTSIPVYPEHILKAIKDKKL